MTFDGAAAGKSEGERARRETSRHTVPAAHCVSLEAIEFAEPLFRSIRLPR